MEKKYKIIYADPPWFYNKRNLFGKDGKRNNFAWGATNHYPVMKTTEICKLPIAELADKNCILFMWATFPRLPDALDVIKAWGFEYKTVAFTWVKTMKNGQVRMDGIGNYTMANAEICLIATKGKISRKNTGVKQIILSPKTEHSRKPAEARERIVELMGDLPRIELFAREDNQPTLTGKKIFDGWDTFGNEAKDSIKL